MRKPKPQKIIQLPNTPGAPGLNAYQKRGFTALNKVLAGNNGAALLAAAKMIFEATGMLNQAPPPTEKPIIVSLNLTGVDPDSDASSGIESNSATG